MEEVVAMTSLSGRERPDSVEQHYEDEGSGTAVMSCHPEDVKWCLTGTDSPLRGRNGDLPDPKVPDSFLPESPSLAGFDSPQSKGIVNPGAPLPARPQHQHRLPRVFMDEEDWGGWAV
ncbi:UNVERIFIED_CONTAM: hypothetical protein FKN15_076666 [Acipenser sinensis]